MCYEKFVRPILFKIDPERIHDIALFWGGVFGKFWLTRKVIRSLYYYKNEKLNISVNGINFDNPVGLAAGFDKNAALMDILPEIGFGFEEIGSITGERCEGNPKPRIFRLPKDQALAVNYGLCNLGAEAISKKLSNRKFRFPLGINIARANNEDIVMDVDKGIEDYIKAYNFMKDIGDFIVINISCPNTPDKRAFSLPSNFSRLMGEFNKFKITKPCFIKLKPDYPKRELDELIEISYKYKFITGFVISNLTKYRKGLKSSDKELENVEGSISGMPIKERSDEIIKYVYRKTKGKKVIIGVGGIFNAEDAYRKIRNGASLVQLITGMIYKGPKIVKDINKGLVNLLEKDNFKSIKEAIGVDV